MSSSEAFLNSFSKGLANSLNKPTSSQFFKKRVGVGVWSGRKWIKPPQFYFYNTIYEPTCCKYFSEHKQKETRWWGTLGLRSALRGGSRQANSTCWRQAPGACKPPSPRQFWQGITAFLPCPWTTGSYSQVHSRTLHWARRFYFQIKIRTTWRLWNKKTNEKTAQLKASLLLSFHNLTTVVITAKCMELPKESKVWLCTRNCTGFSDASLSSWNHKASGIWVTIP